jgi:Pyruvate/2-oxoacid:ferredoxin oxidoreductase gamma subunit
MLKITGEPKDYGVATAGVRRLTEDFSRLAVAYLKHTTGIDRSTQIDAHADEPIFTNIIMPGIVMSITRIDAIDSTLETINSIASSYVLDDLEKFFVVH